MSSFAIGLRGRFGPVPSLSLTSVSQVYREGVSLDDLGFRAAARREACVDEAWEGAAGDITEGRVPWEEPGLPRSPAAPASVRRAVGAGACWASVLSSSCSGFPSSSWINLQRPKRLQPRQTPMTWT